MATSVSMQTPVSDYGNFGAVASQNWNAAAERALRTDIHNQNLAFSEDVQDFNEHKFSVEEDFAEREYKMKEEKHSFAVMREKSRLRQQEIQRDIARHKFDIADQSTALKKKYKRAQESRIENRGWYDYIDVFGIGDDSYWHPEEETYKDWVKKSGNKMPDYDDYVIPEDAGVGALEYYRSTNSLDGSLGLPTSALMDLIKR